MASSILSAVHFHSEQAAYDYIEARLWPDGPACPFCGATKEHVGRLRGKTTRIGLCKCYACRKPFTVKIGTIFEDSHLPLKLWLQAIYLLCSSKKGFSTRQLQRTLGCGMKTAWHLSTDERLKTAKLKAAIPVLAKLRLSLITPKETGWLPPRYLQPDMINAQKPA